MAPKRSVHAWVPAETAAAALNTSRRYVSVLARQGRLQGQVRAGRRWVRWDSVEGLLAEREDAAQRWVTYCEAAVIAGVSAQTIWKAVQAGELVQRPQAGTALPSLLRESVSSWAEQRTHRRQEAERRAAERVKRAAESGPPRDGNEWLDPIAAAAILGITPRGVRHRVGRAALPHVKRGGRLWLRRDDVERAAETQLHAPK